MNLLDATSHVLEAARESAGADRPPLKQAIRRVERRTELLRLRAVKARRRMRHRAFWHAMKSYAGGFAHKPLRCVFCCPHCSLVVDFGVFVKHAVIDGRAHFKTFVCPSCGFDLVPGIRYDLILPGEL
jgi:hypothetical protein